MAKPKVVFIIGANGVGKSTVIPFLKSLLSDKSFEIHDFDERGVPDNAGKEWRQSEVLFWTELGKDNIQKGITTIVCGFAKWPEIFEAAKTIGVEPMVILLDANPETIALRIRSRYRSPENVDELFRTTGKTPEKFIMDNVYASSLIREDAKNANLPIIETTILKPDQVAGVIKNLVTET